MLRAYFEQYYVLFMTEWILYKKAFYWFCWTRYLTMKLALLLFLILFLVACSSTSPTDVKKSDAQSIKNIEYGIIKSSTPVKVNGEGGIIGATTGAMIGGLLGTAVCRENEIAGTKCQDIGIV